MTERLGLRERELIAIVGAGGKSSLLRLVGAEVAADSSVILTTTTKMGLDQVSEPAVWSSDPVVISAGLASARTQRRALFVARERIGEKVVGLDAETVDELFASRVADVIVVEADGARRRAIKAPAAHEPVIPSLSTLVVVVASARAIGRPVYEVAHRPDRFAELAGIDPSDPVSAEDAAAVLLHGSGGRKDVPSGARLRYVITPADDDADAAPAVADAIARGNGSPEAIVWVR